MLSSHEQGQHVPLLMRGQPAPVSNMRLEQTSRSDARSAATASMPHEGMDPNLACAQAVRKRPHQPSTVRRVGKSLSTLSAESCVLRNLPSLRNRLWLAVAGVELAALQNLATKLGVVAISPPRIPSSGSITHALLAQARGEVQALKCCEFNGERFYVVATVGLSNGRASDGLLRPCAC